MHHTESEVLTIAVKSGVTISDDMCLVHNNKFVGNVSHWESCSSTNECWVVCSH